MEAIASGVWLPPDHHFPQDLDAGAAQGQGAAAEGVAIRPDQLLLDVLQSQTARARPAAAAAHELREWQQKQEQVRQQWHWWVSMTLTHDAWLQTLVVSGGSFITRGLQAVWPYSICDEL